MSCFYSNTSLYIYTSRFTNKTCFPKTVTYGVLPFTIKLMYKYVKNKFKKHGKMFKTLITTELKTLERKMVSPKKNKEQQGKIFKIGQNNNACIPSTTLLLLRLTIKHFGQV